MATHEGGTVPAQAVPMPVQVPKKISPVRNVIGLVLLVSLSTVAFLEWNANRRSSSGISKLNATLAKEEGDLLSMPEVEALLGRAPDGPGVVEGNELKVTYTWRGVFRKYPVVAYYKGKNKPALLRIE